MIANQKGQILIFTLIFMLVVTMLIVGLVGYAGVQIKSHRQAVNRTVGLDIAEAGAEIAVWKLNNQSGYTGETNTAYGNGVYTVTITNLSGSSKLITVDSYVPNATDPIAHRKVQITSTIGTTNIGFNYGVQVGNGGLEMKNTSRVIGNVYSNGTVEGENSARISGDVIVAGATGKVERFADIDEDVTAHFIEDASVDGSTSSSSLLRTTVGGSVVSDSISNCTIGGNATYDTKTLPCTIGGIQTTPNLNDFVDPPVIPLPITQAQIDAWKTEAEVGGVITSQTYTSGTTNLGPKKINGDLDVKNTATLNVTGTLWVTGKITFQNSAIVRLDSGYGGLSGVIVAGVTGSTTAGLITLKNSAQVQGSGTSGSYMMLLSEMVNTSSTSIDAGNTGSAAILYAGTGLIDINNSGAFKEITAAKIKVSNSATITYETGLANSAFSSGPSGGWEVSDGTWQLLL